MQAVTTQDRKLSAQSIEVIVRIEQHFFQASVAETKSNSVVRQLGWQGSGPGKTCTRHCGRGGITKAAGIRKVYCMSNISPGQCASAACRQNTLP
nr:hypothetical protein CFP56_22548 [Quercus suber]